MIRRSYLRNFKKNKLKIYLINNEFSYFYDHCEDLSTFQKER